jgi:cytochrome P450
LGAEDGPVVRVHDPSGLDHWLVTRYEEARAALGDARLSKDPRRAWESLRRAGVVSGEPEQADFNMLASDPPDHTRLRRLVGKAFTPRRVQDLRQRVQEIADDLVELMAPKGTTDLIGAFAFPLAVTVICELLGVPAADRSDFRTWTACAVTSLDRADLPLSQEEGGRRLREYVVDLVGRRRHAGDGRRTPDTTDAQPDLVGALLVARDEDNRLSEGELVEMILLLLFGGHETTTNLIGNGMAALLQHPDQLDLLLRRPDLLARAIEELLRYDGPSARASPRVATEDVELGGVVVPAGTVVIVGLAAANRDPSQFRDPDRLDITRTDRSHLAFGHGIHFCIGAALARIESEIAIGMLLRRFPGITLACPPEELRWRPTQAFHGLAALPVTLGVHHRSAT